MFLLWLITFAVVVSSFFAKILVDHFLTHRIAIIGDAVGLVHTVNPGIAFGIHFPPIIQTILIGCALGVVLWMAMRTRHEPPAHGYGKTIAFGLVLGGGIANILDRIPDGVVTDFIQVGSFPIFNLADSCITVGVMLLLFSMLRSHR